MPVPGPKRRRNPWSRAAPAAPSTTPGSIADHFIPGCRTPLPCQSHTSGQQWKATSGLPGISKRPRAVLHRYRVFRVFRGSNQSRPRRPATSHGARVTCRVVNNTPDLAAEVFPLHHAVDEPFCSRNSDAGSHRELGLGGWRSLGAGEADQRFGLGRITSPSMAKLAVTPRVGSVSTLTKRRRLRRAGPAPPSLANCMRLSELSCMRAPPNSSRSQRAVGLGGQLDATGDLLAHHAAHRAHHEAPVHAGRITPRPLMKPCRRPPRPCAVLACSEARRFL